MAITQPLDNAPSIGRHNQGVMDAISSAKRVAVMLSRAGCAVNHIIISHRNARVVIANNPSLPTFLECAPIRFATTETTMAANVDGVQIEWTIRRTT